MYALAPPPRRLELAGTGEAPLTRRLLPQPFRPRRPRCPVIAVSVALAASLFQIAVLAVLVAAGAWAYRRLRLPSVPWLVAYFVVGALLSLPTSHAAKWVIDDMAASGRGPAGSAMTLGELVSTVAYSSMVLTAGAEALIVWLVLSELAFAYAKGAPAVSVPAIVSLPRRHSSAVGAALLACATAMPAFWLALLVARL